MELGGVAFNGGEFWFVEVMNGDVFGKGGGDNSCEFFEEMEGANGDEFTIGTAGKG